MTAVKEKQTPDKTESPPNEKEALPKFDVTSGGYLHIRPEDLIDSKAAQRQLDAVERLSKQQSEKKK
jgi:hypothetical protein